MSQQESIINEYEKKYNDLVEPTVKKYVKMEEELEKEKNKNNDLGGGVLA